MSIFESCDEKKKISSYFVDFFREINSTKKCVEITEVCYHHFPTKLRKSTFLLLNDTAKRFHEIFFKWENASGFLIISSSEKNSMKSTFSLNNYTTVKNFFSHFHEINTFIEYGNNTMKIPWKCRKLYHKLISQNIFW